MCILEFLEKVKILKWLFLAFSLLIALIRGFILIAHYCTDWKLRYPVENAFK